MKKILRISVNGQSYDVEAEIFDDYPSAAAPAAGSAAIRSASADATPTAAAQPRTVSNPSAAAGDIPSPIAATVVSVLAPAGSEVAEGDVLMVLEAMKMNTEITSPCAGKVTTVSVSQGQTVEEGQTLMTIA
ncbi:biotin/lipoyl-containing protein [Desulfogranum mediterraneum]|uniref:biotin/lipoyl-containing protein n=1 Tax=Desulfogranum mediterraneum TaxID=160661 RepID=UPI0004915BC7|nr:biotin/lipoyl-containing protein [Desulfogranum mediterraneum]